MRSAGMFSNVNELIQYLFLAESQGFKFFVDWRHSCYFEEKYGSNPWEYYFEQCFPEVGAHNIQELSQEKKEAQDLPFLPVGKAVACSKKNIITPRIHDGQCNPLLLPKNRNIPHQYISRYLTLNNHVQSLINDFERLYFEENEVIGLHLRGLGRNHGGALQMRAKGQSQFEIDYPRFFKFIDHRLVQQPEMKIFVCSDSQIVIDRVYDHYGDIVISYSASRSEFGEMHANHQNNQGLDFSPYKLGLDVLVEAYLLARTDYFVHGNSNVANFVLSLNPELESSYTYAD
jgi:hypothetical protein